ncbi:response regulator [Neobacillus dielmonensis]|uniref:response regulator n=1 Tax=Neobacillus dielmonensis TaxID=1347369 RepID=UPI0005A5E7FE|nr:response regulator [Neobacillus dielmonensis]
MDINHYKNIEREENIPMIQIIDEDISTLIFLKEALEKKGWMVVTNTDPEKAASQHLEWKPDCVIIIEPLSQGGHGFQALSAIQNHHKQSYVPVVVISLNKNRETRLQAYRLGADDVFEKPLDLEEMIVRIERLLSRKKLFDQFSKPAPRQELTVQVKKPLYVSIIDDDAIIRTMLMKVLNTMDAGFYELQLEAFDNGIQFFDSKRLEKPGQHFLILDGIMPVMDGMEILQKVRKLYMDENLYILMLTGRKSEADIEKALKLGADDYMTKPFSIRELQARIERLVKRMK